MGTFCYELILLDPIRDVKGEAREIGNQVNSAYGHSLLDLRGARARRQAPQATSRYVDDIGCISLGVPTTPIEEER